MITLDSRTWLVWGACTMVPLLVSRHPLLVAELLVIVLAVRFVGFPHMRSQWRMIARIAAVMAVLGVVFNVLTVRSGNQVLTHVPILDWPITWNAIAYGLVSGLAMITLVLTGITAAAGLDWIALTRVLPARLAPLAVSGSVAWAFVPAAGQSITEIREAQAARGHEIRGGRDILPLVVPLLDGGMGRALAMAEALEARGFGAQPQQKSNSRWQPPFAGAALTGLLVAAYSAVSGRPMLALTAIALAAAGVVLWNQAAPQQIPTTRYRQHVLAHADLVVMAISLLAMAVFLVLWRIQPDAVVFNPYPNLAVEPTSVAMVLTLALLLVPALYPGGEGAR